ncbi:MAG: DUF3090 family protein [Actinobacteria bacterium]|nr:DUF3090 family protein [Actinomycetota bacterium]MCB9390348.1 DUF3090 family protein [Acidimicrobiia bacterium]
MELIDIGLVNSIMVGANGPQGERAFMLQARSEDQVVTVLLEKQQVAELSSQLRRLLQGLAATFPGTEPSPAADKLEVDLPSDAEPDFRARAVRVGFEPTERLLQLEFFEYPGQDDQSLPDEGIVLRCLATVDMVHAMSGHALNVVNQGRPLCPYCRFPLVDDHRCPAVN